MCSNSPTHPNLCFVVFPFCLISGGTTATKLDVGRHLLVGIQSVNPGFVFSMPVRVQFLGVFLSAGKRKRGYDTILDDKFGTEWSQNWKVLYSKKAYVFFQAGIPHLNAGPDKVVNAWLNDSLFWLVATEKLYKDAHAFTTLCVSNIGNSACIHAEAFRGSLTTAQKPRSTVEEWTAKPPVKKIEFMNNLLPLLQKNGWCLDNTTFGTPDMKRFLITY